jgi:hypothetical protein
MIKDTFLSFRDNFKERISNPFLGTYLAVWLLRNWDLIYSLFNFDDEFSLDEKIKFIETYYENHEFLVDLAFNILWTFAVLITTYILTNLSRLIVNLFEKRLSPWIYKITDSKSIVKKSDYELLESRLESVQGRYEKEKEARNRLETENEELERKVAKSNSNKDDGGIFVGLKDGSQNLESTKSNMEPDKIKKAVQKIIEDGRERTFLEIARKSKKQEDIPTQESKNLDFFIDYGLIKVLGKGDYGRGHKIELSELGLKVYRQLVEIGSIE